MQVALLPFSQYLRELLRPWKLFTFGVAMLLLLWGALTLEICDWDVGITLLMGGMTYLCAPWSVRVLAHCTLHRPSNAWILLSAALLASWAAIDGVYVAYHALAGNLMLRWDNLCVSTPTYLLAGIFWLHAGTLRSLIHALKSMSRS